MKVAPHGMWAHKHTAEHLRAVPVVQAAQAETENAAAAGLVRLYYAAEFYDHLAAIGVRTEMLPTSVEHESARGRVRPLRQPWTEAWAGAIANWDAVDTKTRKRALARVAADPALRASVPECQQDVDLPGARVSLKSFEWNPSAMATISTEREHGRIAGSSMWNLYFDEVGHILEITRCEIPHLRIATHDAAPPLHLMVQAVDIIEHFARCNAAIRWLAGAP